MSSKPITVPISRLRQENPRPTNTTPTRPTASEPRTITVPVRALQREAARPAEPERGSAVGRTIGNALSTAWEIVNPVPLIRGVGSYVMASPPEKDQMIIDLASGLWDSHKGTFQKGREAFTEGRLPEAAAYTVASALPIVGPLAASKGEEVRDQLIEGDVAGAIGTTVGVPLGLVAPAAAARAGASRGLTVTRPRLPKNAAEADAVRFAQAEGIPLDMGTATGSKFLKNVQHRLEGTIGGASVVERAKQGQEAALAATGNKLAGRANASGGVAGPAVDGAVAGEQVGQNLNKRITDAAKEQRTAYGHVDAAQQQGRIPQVDVGAAKTAFRPIFDELAEEMASSRGLQGNKLTTYLTLKKLMDGPDVASFSVADQILSELKGLARTDDIPALRTRGQGLASQAAKKLGDEVTAAAQAAGPDVLQALQEGRAATVTKYDLAGVRDTVVKAEPRSTYQGLIAQKDGGIAKLRELQRTAPDQLPTVARAVLEDILDKPTSEGGFRFADGAQANWQKLGDQTKRALFAPDHAKALDDFFLLAKKLTENRNPSGTANVLGLSATQALAYLPAKAIAKILYSPTAIKAMTTGIRLSMSPSKASQAAAAAQYANALRLAGVEPTRGTATP